MRGYHLALAVGSVLSLLLPLKGKAAESTAPVRVALVHYCESSLVKLTENNTFLKADLMKSDGTVVKTIVVSTSLGAIECAALASQANSNLRLLTK